MKIVEEQGVGDTLPGSQHLEGGGGVEGRAGVPGWD